MPLLVVSRAKPVRLPPNVPPAFSREAFEAAWRKGQARLAALLPDVRHEIATESDGLEEMTVAAAQFSDRDLE